MDTPRGRDGERPRARNIGNVETEPHVESHGRTPQVVQPISPVVEAVDQLLLLKLTKLSKSWVLCHFWEAQTILLQRLGSVT